MKRTFGMTLGLIALASAVVSCDQPRIDCTTGHGGFAMKYTLRSGTKTGSGGCDTLKGEIVGLQKYNPSKSGDKIHQDLTKATLAMRADKIGELAAASGVEGPQLDSIGAFVSTVPDDSDVCKVPTLSPVELSVPESQNQPRTDIKYEWSNIRLYVTTAYPGTQMLGELTYTQDGCSATYDVIGLWPAVSCEVILTDAMGNPVNTGMPDVSLCDPVANPDAGRPTGSGINPDLQSRVACDPDILKCVLTSPPASLK